MLSCQSSGSTDDDEGLPLCSVRDHSVTDSRAKTLSDKKGILYQLLAKNIIAVTSCVFCVFSVQTCYRLKQSFDLTIPYYLKAALSAIYITQ